MATFFNDFDEYSIGDMSSVATADWTVQSTFGDWSQVVTADAGAGAGRTVVINRTASGDGSNLVVRDASSTTGNIEAVALLKGNTASDNAVPLGVALVNTADNQAYSLYFSADATPLLSLARFGISGSISTVIGTGIELTKPGAGVYYYARIGRSGTTIRGKLWLASEGEPDWQISGTNTTLTTVKAGMFVRDFSVAPYTFDLFGAGTGGDAAPKVRPVIFMHPLFVLPQPTELPIMEKWPSGLVWRGAVPPDWENELMSMRQLFVLP